MTILRYFAALGLLVAGLLSAQSIATPPATQTYVNPEIGLRLNYPAIFNREEPAGLSRFERSILTLHPTPEGTQAAVDPCTPVLLALGSGLDRPDQIIRKGKPTILQPKGTLSLSEIKRSCVDKDMVDDTLLAQVVGATSKIDGMRPLAKLSNSFTLGSTVWFASAAGFNKDETGKRNASAGTTIIGTAGAVVNSHMLVWTITSNDPELFNRLLNLSVCFDSGCSNGLEHLVQFRLNTPSKQEIAAR